MKNHQERIQLDDTFMDIMMKLSDGNPGAIHVLSELFEKSAEIDRLSAWGAYTGAIGLDTTGIYGSEIWVLYKDICNQDIECVLAVLRAIQLGITRRSDVFSAIRDGSGLDVQSILKNVKDQLGDDFGDATK